MPNTNTVPDTKTNTDHTLTIVVTGSREFPTDAAGTAQVRAAVVTAARCLVAVALTEQAGAPTEVDGADPVPTPKLRLIHGAAAGLDTLAAQVTADLGWIVTAVPAQWSEHTHACPQWHTDLPTCRMAGHRRNAQMLDMGPDLVVGFPMHPKNSSGSRGTWGCIDAAVARKLPVLVYSEHSLWLDPASKRNAATAPGAYPLARYIMTGAAADGSLPLGAVS